MSHEYSGESTYNQNVCVRFQKHINSIAVDRSGEHCVLGGKKSLYVIKLEEPNELAKTISNSSSKWDISIIEWNPHAAKSSLIASAANQEAHIWDSGEGRLVTTIPPHQRAVSDIGWSPSEPNVLVTASLDSYINLWDVRDPNRALSMKRFSKYNGAVQAKWNRRNSAILASAHEGMIFIWDIRKEGQPIASITAHNTQIYGIDWSYLNTNEIISCSQDKMVKLWSIDNPRECKMVLQTGTPVLRAKYLPFSTGIVTVAERGNYILRLWSIKDPTTPPTVPIHAFVGHSDGIRSFDWRISRPKEDIQRLDAIQMLSWSKDQSLRFWCFDNSHLAACGIYATPQPSHRRGSVYFFGDLPPDSPTVPNKYTNTSLGVNSPHFDAMAKYSTGFTPGDRMIGTPSLTVGSTAMHATHPVYMGDSLGEGYFGGMGGMEGMEDLLGGGHSDEGEEFRNSLLHVARLQNKFGSTEGREEKITDIEKMEEQEGELRVAEEKNELSQVDLVTGLPKGTVAKRLGDEMRNFPPEDQGLIPGDLEHEFLLLKKKKFSGINIVQANAAQRTMVIHIDDGDQQHDRKFQLKITFPSLYPHNASPSFVISDIDTSLVSNTPYQSTRIMPPKQSASSSALLATTPPSAFTKPHLASPLSPAASRANTRFLENLKRIAELRVSHNMPCIESCLIKLVAMLREDERMSQITNQIKQKNPHTGVEVERGKTGQVESAASSSTVAPLLNDMNARESSPSFPQLTSPRAHTPDGSSSSAMPSKSFSPVIIPPLTSSPVIDTPSTSIPNNMKAVPHIQIFTSDASVSNSGGMEENYTNAENTSSLDFGLAAFSMTGDSDESNADSSTKVIRSKSTVELRSAVSGNQVGSEVLSVRSHTAQDATPPTSKVNDTAAPLLSTTSNTVSPLGTSNEATSTGIRRSRSAGYNRLSGRYIESIAMNIPSPRICSVAISPTGKLVYFQTLHCKNPVLPNISSPQPATAANSLLTSSASNTSNTPSTVSNTDMPHVSKLVDTAEVSQPVSTSTESPSKSSTELSKENMATEPNGPSDSAQMDLEIGDEAEGCYEYDSSDGIDSCETMEDEEPAHSEPESADARTTKANAINNTINSIINKDAKQAHLTLPFFGVFPRTYPELTTILSGSKVANQFTTNDTFVLAQLKSLNSLRVSTKMYITDISNLMPTNVQLAANYRLLGNLLDVCDHNQAAARKLHRLDLVKVWRTLYVLCNPVVYSRPFNNHNFSTNQSPGPGHSTIAFFREPWVALPIARNLVSALFKHYEGVGDVQTLAMISCVLLQSKLNLRSARSARHMSGEEENEISLLDPAKEPCAHAYRYAYGEMLNKWGLLVKRAELLKHTFSVHPRSHSYSPGTSNSYFPTSHRGVTFGVICASCDQKLKDNFFCATCKTSGFKCAICNLSVKGLSNFCILCGHGGHAHHMATWFQRENFCPAGCNCECVFQDEYAKKLKHASPVHDLHPSTIDGATTEINSHEPTKTSGELGNQPEPDTSNSNFNHPTFNSSLHDTITTQHELGSSVSEVSTFPSAYLTTSHPNPEAASPDLLDTPLFSHLNSHSPTQLSQVTFFPNQPADHKLLVSNAIDEL